MCFSCANFGLNERLKCGHFRPSRFGIVQNNKSTGPSGVTFFLTSIYLGTHHVKFAVYSSWIYRDDSVRFDSVGSVKICGSVRQIPGSVDH
jgi:hypothetical protein